MIRGGLFTRFFKTGFANLNRSGGLICLSSPPSLARCAGLASALVVERRPHPSKAETESEFINPIIGALGGQRLPRRWPRG